jgi:hypothetical protein
MDPQGKGQRTGMKRLAMCAGILPAVLMTVMAGAQRRFGFEFNEGAFFFQPYYDQLLGKLERICPGGDINVNFLGQGWDGMQPHRGDPVNFTTTDNWVRLFQRHGYSLAWYLVSNAAWAWPYLGYSGPGHLAPAPEYEKDWKNYVKAVVERYDGDGVEDMPGLFTPVRSYIMQGEIKFGISGQGDGETGPFWADVCLQNNLDF